MRARTLVALVAAPFAVSLLACGVDSSNTDSGGAAPATATATTVKATKPSGPADTITDDGTYLVGKDIRAGQWRAKVPADAVDCYWERMRNTDGDFDSIIANENVQGGGQALVTVKASDKAFKTAGCGTWTRVSG